ncbi:MAG: RecQ family ATP-dependent DNA helicase [Paludibacteraceae bacterium]|nr:RecQ family ATP-dependent DNA helicase [Paludibacteraceae bacterium]
MTAQEALKTYWGYDDFRPLQAEIVESVLAGRDTLALMPTGGGKSLCFQVPTMVMGGLCLVISPLIALMKDQVENLRRRNILAAAIYTGMSYEQQKTALDNCMWGPYHFLYVSPERLESEEFRERLAHLPICMIAVDEAHCISQWGYDFRPSYLKIAEIRDVVQEFRSSGVQEFRSSGVQEFRSEGVPSEHLNSSSAASEPLNSRVAAFNSHIPILALTATATPDVVDDIQERLAFREKNVLRKSFARPNISYVVRETNKKADEIVHILSRVPGSAIVYVRNRQRSQEIAAYLQEKGISADYYHAGLSSKERSQKQEAWKKFRSSEVQEFRSEGVPSEHLNSSSAASAPLNRGKASSAIRVIVATNAFGMGIDKPDVRVVIHHDLPDTIEAYFQEAGRAGRDEQKAFAVLLYDPSDKSKARKRVADNYPDEETLHNVYHKTCNYLGVGADSGQGATFFIDVFDLCKKMHLPVFPTYSALHLLSQMGYFGFDEEQEIHPRVRLRVSRRELEEYRLNEEENSLLEHLMREYTGIFTDLQYVHNLDEKHQELVALAQKRIIDYVPRTKANVLRLTVNRQAEIRIPHEFYNDRKNHYVSKLKAMVEYAENQHYCRSQVMLGYFGENDAPVCGTCDICRANNKH